MITPLMRLQDPQYTRIVIVALPEPTPVSEAAALQDDLRRAGIQPFGWVINRSLAGGGTRDPVLAARMAAQRTQVDRVLGGLAPRTWVVPWRATPPRGIAALRALVESLPGGRGVHDLHVWAMGTTEVALTAHLEMPEPPTDDAFLRHAGAQLRERFANGHATLQIVRQPFCPPCAD